MRPGPEVGSAAAAVSAVRCVLCGRVRCVCDDEEDEDDDEGMREGGSFEDEDDFEEEDQ